MSKCTLFQKRFLELIEDLECKKSEIPKTLNIEYDVFTKIVEYGKLPKPVILMRIADFFNISVEYLLGRTNDTFFEKNEFYKTFKDRFIELKNEKQLTSYAITKTKMHVSTSYATNWEKRNIIPTLDNLIILSEIFDVSLDYLLGRTDYKK